MSDIDVVTDLDSLEQMKTEHVSLMAQITKSLSQLVIHPPDFITLCVHLCLCLCMDGFLYFPFPLLCVSVHKVWSGQMKPITGTSLLFLTHARTTWPLTTIYTLTRVRNELLDSISYIVRILFFLSRTCLLQSENDVFILVLRRVMLSDSEAPNAVTSKNLAAPHFIVSHLKHPSKRGGWN